MKFLLSLLCLVSFSTFAQVETVPTRDEIESDISIMQENASTEEEKRFLSKFKDWTKGVAQKDFVKKTGKGLGKASSFISTETLRPFVSAGSFLRGVFTKDSPDSRVRALAYSFYVENEKDLNELYKNPELLKNELENGENVSIMAAYKNMVVNQFKEKALNTLKGILNDVNFDPEVEINGDLVKLSQAKSLEQLSEMIQLLKIEENPFLLLEIDAEKLNKSTLDKHLSCNGMKSIAPHIEIAPLISSLTKAAISGEELDTNDFKKAISEELMNDIEAFIAQFIEFEDGIWKNKSIVSEVGETVGSVVAKFAVPSIVLGSVVSGAGSVYLGVTALSAVGTTLSVSTCTKNKNIEKLKEDEDFRNFCSYVIMRNSQKLLKSKAKGYLAGMSLRDSIKMIKYRRDFIKECSGAGNSKSKCRDQYRDEKSEYILSCLDFGYSKKECKRMRKRELLSSVN